MSQTVISDILISTNPITDADFDTEMTHGSSPGYSKFVNFITGDYEYQKAIFKMKSISVDSNRGILGALTLNVDVQDIIEKGSATISTAATGVSVVYSSTFHATPELVPAFKSGTAVAIPEITTQDATGFTVKLWDPVGSQYITGSITWAAHGY